MKEFPEDLFKKYPIACLVVGTIAVGLLLQSFAEDHEPSKEEIPLLADTQYITQCKNIVREKIGVPVTFAHQVYHAGVTPIAEGRVRVWIYLDTSEAEMKAECFFNENVMVDYHWKNRYGPRLIGG